MLEEIKNYLGITWKDEVTESNLSKIIEEGKKYLSEKIGTSIVFEENLAAKSLLKDYCRYVRNYDKEYFLNNFIGDIQELQIKYSMEEQFDKSKT